MQMFDSGFFIGNRQRLYDQLPSVGSLALTANGAMQRGPDSAFMFEQEANFWYLTGVDVADWRLIVDLATGEEWLVEPSIPDIQKTFDGSLNAEEAMSRSGISQVLNEREGLQKIRKMAAKGSMYSLFPQARREHGFFTNRAQFDLVRQLHPAKIQDVRQIMGHLRAIKQPVEIQALRAAIDVTVDGIKAMLADLPTYKNEYEVEARLSFEFRKHGAKGYAYDPIVASGKNACTLHYIANSAKINSGEMLLFDVGARVNNYCADITRTIPSGQPTSRQKDIYNACLRVHEVAVNHCRPGQNVEDYFHNVERAMGDELMALGLIKNLKSSGIRKYFPHSIGHGLGIDVHDPLGQPEVFAENMVLTVEPGIYVPEEGVGVRIEDDILITKNGPEILSGALPVDIGDL